LKERDVVRMRKGGVAKQYVLGDELTNQRLHYWVIGWVGPIEKGRLSIH
jgi:hypothetical protein